MTFISDTRVAEKRHNGAARWRSWLSKQTSLHPPLRRVQWQTAVTQRWWQTVPHCGYVKGEAALGHRRLQRALLTGRHIQSMLTTVEVVLELSPPARRPEVPNLKFKWPLWLHHLSAIIFTTPMLAHLSRAFLWPRRIHVPYGSLVAGTESRWLEAVKVAPSNGTNLTGRAFGTHTVWPTCDERYSVAIRYSKYSLT